MSALDVLRPGVLAGVRVAVAGGGGDGAGPIAARLAGLGAEVLALGADLDDEDAVVDEVGAAGRIDVLVVEGAARFGAAGAGVPGLRAAVDGGWNAVRAVVNACWTTEGQPGGKVVLVAPPPDAGDHAEAVGAAMENMARSLSIEWARFGVRPTAVRPGPSATAAEIAELVAFLASPGGDYYSGCAFSTV